MCLRGHLLSDSILYKGELGPHVSFHLAHFLRDRPVQVWNRFVSRHF